MAVLLKLSCSLEWRLDLLEFLEQSSNKKQALSRSKLQLWAFFLCCWSLFKLVWVFGTH